METTDYCNYDLSLALKECGFDEPCEAFYLPPMKSRPEPFFSGRVKRSIKNETHAFHLSAPSLYHAQKWLREKLLLHVGANPAIPTLKWQFYIDDLNQHINPHDGGLMTRWDDDMQEKADERLYDSYEAALSAGISAALEVMKKGN